ncbi:hypothetical protein [Dyadobacter sp. 22481]|uniref:hypothetical protein n=1 Tax=Dyadobacter sp. 22481 TaxID=3453926 RepID=UPI003F8545FC
MRSCSRTAAAQFAKGVGEAVVRNLRAVTVDLPQTLREFASTATLAGNVEAAVGVAMLYEKTKSDWNSGDVGTRANIAGNVVGEVAIAVAGSKGVGNLGKAGEVANVTSKVSEVTSVADVSSSVLSASETLRIQNAATRIIKLITVIGSRAAGVVKNDINTIKGAVADWDYVIPGLTSKNWGTIKNSLPGARSVLDNTPRNIDIFKKPVDTNLPRITINPR